MDLGIKGKKALVTGASRGIGMAIAQALATEGAKVAVVARTAKDITGVLETMGGEQKGHLGIIQDLVPEGAPSQLYKALSGRDFDDVDIVVHNLGGTLDIEDPFCPIEEWRKVYRCNLEIAVELNLLTIPHMKTRKWGRILNISSISSMENHGPVPYCSIKSALNAYTRSMGRVLAPEGIIMTSLLPGAVFTKDGYWDHASKDRPEHVRKYLDERMAIKRFGELSEISNIAAFLCSEHASFCVGSIVPVDGGQGRSFFGY